MDRLQSTLEHGLGPRAESIAEQARHGLFLGRKSFWSFEQSLMENIRANSSLYLGGIVALVGLIIAKALFDRNEENPE